MQYDDVVRGRRSIRGYKPEPVPKALIREVLELAMRAPSSYKARSNWVHSSRMARASASSTLLRLVL